MTSTPNRSRRLSSGSTNEASLFPIYEDPAQDTIPLFSDMESVAGSEAGWGDDSSAHMSAVNKEQLVMMLSKMMAILFLMILEHVTVLDNNLLEVLITYNMTIKGNLGYTEAEAE